MHIFTKLHPMKLLLRCAIPNMISAIFFSIYTVVDSIFVGHYLGSNALTAMAIVMPFVFITFAISDMISIGSSVQISMLLGQNKIKEAKILFTTSIAIIIAFSALMGIIGYIVTPILITLFDIDLHIQKLSIDYINMFCYFSPLIMVSFAIDNYLRICNKTVYSMINNIIMAITNIILDYIFIVKLDLGLSGASLATCIGLTLNSIIGIYPFLFCNLQLKFEKLYINLQTFKNILFNGSSEFFSNISGSILMIITNSIILKISEIQYIAILSIISYIDSFIIAILISIHESIQPAISYNNGIQNRHRIKEIIKYTMLSSFIMSLTMLSAIIVFNQEIFSTFIKKGEEALIPIGSIALLIFSTNYLITWFNMLISSYLTACNKPALSLILSMTQNLFAPLVTLIALTKTIGINGVWLTPFIAEIIVLLISIKIIRNDLNLNNKTT